MVGFSLTRSQEIEVEGTSSAPKKKNKRSKKGFLPVDPELPNSSTRNHLAAPKDNRLMKKTVKEGIPAVPLLLEDFAELPFEDEIGLNEVGWGTKSGYVFIGWEYEAGVYRRMLGWVVSDQTWRCKVGGNKGKLTAAKGKTFVSGSLKGEGWSDREVFVKTRDEKTWKIRVFTKTD
jgi:hypothetical protein